MSTACSIEMDQITSKTPFKFTTTNGFTLHACRLKRNTKTLLRVDIVQDWNVCTKSYGYFIAVGAVKSRGITNNHDILSDWNNGSKNDYCSNPAAQRVCP